MLNRAFNRFSSTRVCRYSATLAVLPLSLAMFSLPAQAGLITNGSFEDTGSSTSSFAIDNGGSLPGWTVGGGGAGSHTLDCLVYSGETSGICGPSFGGPNSTPFQFWTDPGASPDGGNYVAVDGDSTWAQPLQTTVNGLTVGVDYIVSFYQAAAQQQGFDGATTEQWQVMFGGSTQTSTLMNNADHGKVDWNQQSLTFTATSTSQVLSFLALGTPNSLPPFVLLDGISVNPASEPAPEPATAAIFLAGLLGIPVVRRLRKNRQ